MNRRYRNRASTITTAVWLIGLGILWLTNTWWPGILIVAGVSMLVQVLYRPSAEQSLGVPTVSPTVEKKPASAEAEQKEKTWEEEKSETPAFLEAEEPVKKDALLPKTCPACGGPIAENAHKVEWMGERTARCPFCNTVINL